MIKSEKYSQKAEKDPNSLKDIKIGKSAIIGCGIEAFSTIASVASHNYIFIAAGTLTVATGAVVSTLNRRRSHDNTSEQHIVPVDSNIKIPHETHHSQPAYSKEAYIKKNRLGSRYLRAFVGNNEGDSEHLYSLEIKDLAQKSDKTLFPDGVYEDIHSTIKQASELAKFPEPRTITLFNSNSDELQPSALGVSIALQKIGFGSASLKRELINNTELDGEFVVRTHATTKGKFPLCLGYVYDGKDTIITLSSIDPNKKPESLEPYPISRQESSGRRARFRGSELYSESIDGISRGRKRGPTPLG